nr:unnamed protein product [Digitaria exilis]
MGDYLLGMRRAKNGGKVHEVHLQWSRSPSGFRKKFVDDLIVARYKRDWGLFIDSCFNHCQTPFRISWHSRISLRLGNKTIAEAVAYWYFGGGHGVKEIDCEYPCINPTCSSQLDL